MDKKSHFKIIGGYGDYIVINTKGEYGNHTHLRSKDVCELLIKLVCRGVVPDKPYLRTSAMRISRDWKYIREIENKIDRDANKSKYININKGVKKRFY
ncbi:MAG TPA: hypothetical protein VFC79_05925 [Tissierellaceae bacterium]|nr:hypothetical protein [Tissierellaceae bacterium]